MATEYPLRRLDVVDSTGNQTLGIARLSTRHSAEHGYHKCECCVAFDYEGEVIATVGTDFFGALCRLRELLAGKKLMPIYYGASRNVFRSGMARDMGEGLTAYKMELGKHAKDLVKIFDSGPDIDLAFVAEQAAFFKE